jgi:hypothetical protein
MIAAPNDPLRAGRTRCNHREAEYCGLAIAASCRPIRAHARQIGDVIAAKLGRIKMAKGRKGLDHRHRDKSGRIERKHGNTKVGALRKEYGPGFAKGRRQDMMLKTLLKETGSTSLHEYLRHHHR